MLQCCILLVLVAFSVVRAGMTSSILLFVSCCVLCSFYVRFMHMFHFVADVNVGKLRSAADLAMSKGEVDQALKLWHEVIAAEPSNEGNFYKRFRVYLRQHKFKEALSDLSSALSVKPTYEAGMQCSTPRMLSCNRCLV